MNTTIYVEDLASTNGTKVNGLSTSHQVVHHLDLIEVGKHKLHFFDDAMLAGGVASLESTVQTDYERTMLAAHVPDVARPAPKARAAEVDLSRTMAIPRESLRQGPSHEVVRTGESPPPAARTPWRCGCSRAREWARSSPSSRPTRCWAPRAPIRRSWCGAGWFYLARFGGTRPPRLNRRDLGPGTHRLAAGDVIEVGGSTFEVMNAVR